MGNRVCCTPASCVFPRLLVLMLLNASTTADAQQAGAARPVALPLAYDLDRDCKGCHEKLPKSNDFIADIPGHVWDTEDKHRQSFNLLRANKRLVTSILGFDWDSVLRDGSLSTEPGDHDRVERVKQCLRCHATWPKNDPAWTEDKPNPPVDLELGVSCQACHGPAKHWSRPHREESWRICDWTAKRRLGLTNLRHPVQRARLCASCHVGSLEEGKFVTHRMYVAGHPPLPSFEFAAFSSQMPAHWRSLREKGDFAGRDRIPAKFLVDRDFLRLHNLHDGDLKQSYLQANFPAVQHNPFADLESTQAALVSGLVVLWDYVKLLQSGFGADAAATTPDFALFDCTACHHELRAVAGSGGRRARSSPPGRPPLQRWPTVVARAGLLQFHGNHQPETALLAEFDQKWAALERAATTRPFGDPAAVHAAAQELRTWLEPRIRAMSRQPFDQATAELAWGFLTDPAQVATDDYHAARQTAWVLSALAKDLGQATWSDALFFPNGHDRLQLKLPARQSGKLLENLSVSLPAIADYDPAWFESVLVKLRTKRKDGP